MIIRAIPSFRILRNGKHGYTKNIGKSYNMIYVVFGMSIIISVMMKENCVISE